jgi:hypothetical protein
MVTTSECKAMPAKWGICHYCSKEGMMTRDHIIPKDLGGPNATWNYVPACQDCNLDKGNASYETFTGKHQLPPSCRARGFFTTEDYINDLIARRDKKDAPKQQAKTWFETEPENPNRVNVTMSKRKYGWPQPTEAERLASRRRQAGIERFHADHLDRESRQTGK